MHFHAGQPFQMYSSHENTPVCKFAENGKKVKPPSVKAPHYRGKHYPSVTPAIPLKAPTQQRIYEPLLKF